jgi:DNA recombination protein RmuC
LALERILEAAGLTEGREYILQGRGLGLKSDTGGIQRPDVVVKLPEGRTMIIDSKIPLVGYERLIEASDETEREVCGGQFVRDVKGHIEGLAGKRYRENRWRRQKRPGVALARARRRREGATRCPSENGSAVWV